MADGSATSPGLAFPRETFAKLTPAAFLQAHLQQKDPIRPSGRRPDEFRNLTINTGSLSHSDGSAVVRVGDTAVVCGVRAEILLASDIPHPPADDVPEDDLVDELGLLVPNVELSTGCSPAHLPGNPPGTAAQALSYRVASLLSKARLTGIRDLLIQYTEPSVDEDTPDQGPNIVTKAYWTLYIDILCIALDGNPFDAIWPAVVAALRDTLLPKAWWDPDREMILCSPLASDASRLGLNGLPTSSTFALFTTTSPCKQRSAAETWILADPDSFEEDLCRDSLTVVVMPTQKGRSSVVSLENNGGAAIDKASMRRCVRMAAERWSEWEDVLRNG